MKFKSIAVPEPSEGFSFKGIVDQTVPSQALSLQEILEKFSRNEPVAVGQDVSWGTDFESEEYQGVDIEKLQYSDIYDKETYKKKMVEIQKRYEKQEAEKAEIERKRIEAETRKQIEDEIRKDNEYLGKSGTKGKSKPSGGDES